VKLGKLQFNKRELASINPELIIEKCISLEFNTELYDKWMAKVQKQDEFISKSVA